jgi:hypothetical protein
VADALSSRGQYELNPILGRGKFGRRQAVVKFSLTTGGMLSSEWAARKSRRARIAVTVLNFGLAGGLAFVASRNARM